MSNYMDLISRFIPQATTNVQPAQVNNAAPVDERERLIQTWLDSMKQPEVPEVSRGRNIAALVLTGLADAVNAGRAAKGRGPGPTQYSGQYMQTLDALRQRREGVKAKNKEAEGRVALYELGQLEKKTDSDEALVRDFKGRQATLEAMRQRGLTIDPELEAVYLATGRLPEQKQRDPLSDLQKIADLGAKGITGLPGDTLGAGEKALAEARRKDATKPEPEGKYAGFKSLKELVVAIDDFADRVMKASSRPQATTVPDPGNFLNGGMKTVVTNVTTVSYEEARRMALRAFPGAEKFLPGYADDEGIRNGKSGITLDDVRRKLGN